MQCAKTGLLPVVRRGWVLGIPNVSPWSPGTPLRNILPIIRGMASKSDCKSMEEKDKKGISCRRPDLRMKPIPPYKYGFCREPDPQMLMSCPPKGAKPSKGPCCHDAGDKKKGGCKKK